MSIQGSIKALPVKSSIKETSNYFPIKALPLSLIQFLYL